MNVLARTPATRNNLLRLRRRLERVTRGVQVLRRKREALVTELFRLARPAADARTAIAEQARRAYPALLAALAIHGRTALRALGWPARRLEVDVRGRSVWGVAVAELTDRPPIRRTLGARGLAPATAGPAGAAAAAAFEDLTDALLAAAPQEMLIRRLGEALARTSRQVHTLEYRLAPGLRESLGRVRQALDEREREERLRLKHLARRWETLTAPS